MGRGGWERIRGFWVGKGCGIGERGGMWGVVGVGFLETVSGVGFARGWRLGIRVGRLWGKVRVTRGFARG